ncbi:DUF6114 domain-containing protein [Micromonospora sp. KC723]|uniref:DUF6114 domain-containing protein n=1 Tax=Micromonospora sp. KC723 TaxID=2530381 RepID=UPI001FB82225|nr:DUF6114 domain-containing protein [Micromonospora sp. KC723]
MTSHGPMPGPTGTRRARWRDWRRSRPFTAGVLITVAGVEMLVTLRAPLGVVLKVGPQGLAAYLVPTVLVLCGVLLLATPQQRVFYALLTLVLALASWLTSNLGGFVVGMLLALVGGSLAFAWTPAKRPPGPRPPAPAPDTESDDGLAIVRRDQTDPPATPEREHTDRPAGQHRAPA